MQNDLENLLKLLQKSFNTNDLIELQNLEKEITEISSNIKKAISSSENLDNHLKKSDQIFSTHRCHAHYLAKGGSLNKMLLEIYGKLGGCLDGRGGSMHLMDENEGIALSIPIVSSSIPLAVGNALTFKLNKLKNVVVSFFGNKIFAKELQMNK